MNQVLIVNTGTANLASVAAAFTRLGIDPIITADPRSVRETPLLVLPGVGSFGAAMQRLNQLGLCEPLLYRVRLQRPLLAICLGMQLLCESSDESPGVPGLGAVGGHLRRFEPPARVPHMGWNQISPTPGTSLLRPATMYFANSYRLDTIPDGWTGATTDYGQTFASAIERGPILACQFHPELSADDGQDLLRRWLTLTQEGVTC